VNGALPAAAAVSIGEAGTTAIESTIGANGANVTVRFTMTPGPKQTPWLEAVVRTAQTRNAGALGH